MSDIDVKRLLPLHVTWMLGCAMFWLSWTIVTKVRLGQDSHAYWAAWQGDWSTMMYDIGPNQVDAYNYSPAFAQAIFPIAQLPWPIFGVAWSLMAGGALVYLLRPLGWRWVFPLLLLASPELLSGNVFWLMALVAALGLRSRPVSGAVWALSALTKITPTVGPIWFVVRREWWALLGCIVATGIAAGLSYAVSPDLWRQWVGFLTDHEASTQPVGAEHVPPLAYRLPAAVALTVWGALTTRRWTVPLAMAIATPVAGIAALTILAAIPRLMIDDAAERRTGVGDEGPRDSERFLFRRRDSEDGGRRRS